MPWPRLRRKLHTVYIVVLMMVLIDRPNVDINGIAGCHALAEIHLEILHQIWGFLSGVFRNLIIEDGAATGVSFACVDECVIRE